MAREATDIANLRSAKAEATAALLTANKGTDGKYSITDGGTTVDLSGTVYYDTAAGKLTNTAPSPVQGKGTDTKASNDYTEYTKEYGYDGTAVNTKNIECTFNFTNDTVSVHFTGQTPTGTTTTTTTTG